MSRSSTILFSLTGAAALLLGAEMLARAAFGLGSPLLSVEDPDVGYMLRPGQSLRRFGQDIFVNRFGMRSPDFADRPGETEIRILVVGDSVVNGGTRTDQRDLATSRAVRPLQSELHRPVVIANVSTNGWAPGHQLAYLERFGVFSAQTAILVLSSHDASPSAQDAPFDSRIYPTAKPMSALGEGLSLIASRIWRDPAAPPAPGSIESARHGGLEALSRMMRLFAREGVAVCVLLHPTQHELRSRPDPGQADIREVAIRAGVKAVDLSPLYRAARRDVSNLYVDDIHLNAAGQAVLADALIEAARGGFCRKPRA